MTEALEILAGALVLLGTFFCFTGGIGVLRFPDFYTRLHAAGMTDSMGAALILAGLAVHQWTDYGAGLNLGRLAIIWFFLNITSAASTHALVKAAYAGGVRVNGPTEDRRSGVPN